MSSTSSPTIFEVEGFAPADNIILCSVCKAPLQFNLSSTQRQHPQPYTIKVRCYACSSVTFVPSSSIRNYTNNQNSNNYNEVI